MLIVQANLKRDVTAYNLPSAAMATQPVMVISRGARCNFTITVRFQLDIEINCNFPIAVKFHKLLIVQLCNR